MSNNTHKTVYFNGGEDSDSSDSETTPHIVDTQGGELSHIDEQTTDNNTGAERLNVTSDTEENLDIHREEETQKSYTQGGDNDDGDDDDNGDNSDAESGTSIDSMSTNDIISIHPLQLILSRFLTTNIDEKNTTTQRTITNVLEDILTELKTMNKNLNENRR